MYAVKAVVRIGNCHRADSKLLVLIDIIVMVGYERLKIILNGDVVVF